MIPIKTLSPCMIFLALLNLMIKLVLGLCNPPSVCRNKILLVNKNIDLIY
jgi:hypothetical protein